MKPDRSRWNSSHDPSPLKLCPRCSEPMEREGGEWVCRECEGEAEAFGEFEKPTENTNENT